MKNDSRTFTWVATALLVTLITPNLYIDYQSIEQDLNNKLTRDQLVKSAKQQNPEYYKDWGDDQIFRGLMRDQPELSERIIFESVGERLYKKFGSREAADFGERLGFQLNIQTREIKVALITLAPWISAEAGEKARGFANQIYRDRIANNQKLQAYAAWKEDKPQTNDFATFLRTLSESLPSLLIIGFPLFFLSMFNFFFISKNDMNEIIKKYGFDKKGFSKFNFEVKGVVGSFFKFFIYWCLISKSILVAGIEIIGVSRKSKKSLKLQEVKMRTNAKALILTFMQAEGVILLATFSYFVFQSN
jgi:hypothetical protein